MCIPPPPVRYRCRQCHWVKDVTPRSDALGPGDYYLRCPRCGSDDLECTKRLAGSSNLIGRLLGQLSRHINQSFHPNEE
jgi:peptide subunit release factor 1 (eRF1)